MISLKSIKQKDIGISNNKEYTCLKLKNEIVVLSNELGFLVASLDLNDGRYPGIVLFLNNSLYTPLTLI